MHAEDETGAERPIDPLDRLRQDLRSPLTTIGGRAYLLARAVRRAPSLSEDERTRLLASVATIEAAVAEMVVVIDGIGGSPPRSSPTTQPRSDPESIAVASRRRHTSGK